jgi:hypothetical protein
VPVFKTKAGNVFDSMRSWLNEQYVQQGAGLLASYHRGQVSLEARRAVTCDELLGKLTQGRPAQRLVAEVADELHVATATLVEDDIFATPLTVII